MKRNLLLEYSEELAVKIVKLCTEYKIDSNTVFWQSIVFSADL